MKKFLKYWISAAIFAISFIVYLTTLDPGLAFTDAGELAAACSTYGIAHPTGYPLFVNLGYLWSKLPLGASPIYKMNIFSAFLTALAAALFFHIFNILLSNFNEQKTPAKSKRSAKSARKSTAPLPEVSIKILSAAGALTFAFAGLFWETSSSVEVYPLHFFMTSLLLLCAAAAFAGPEKSGKYFIAAAFFAGLSLANHMTTILLFPAFIFLFLYLPGNRFTLPQSKIKLFLVALIPFLAALSLYLFLPIRSAGSPEFDWGGVSRGFYKFLYHVQGKQYQVWMFADSSVVSDNLKKFFAALPAQLGWIGIIPFVAGVVFAFNRGKVLFRFLTILIISCLAYSTGYSIHDVEPYFAAAYIGIILFVGVGMFALAKTNSRLASASFAIPILSLILNYSACDKSDDYAVEEYTRIALESLQPNALIVSAQWDYFCSAFWYKQRIEGERPDVVMIEKELLRRTWYPAQLERWYPDATAPCRNIEKEYLEILERFESDKPYDKTRIQSLFVGYVNCLLDSNYGKRPLYLTFDVMQTDPQIGANYLKIPEGFAVRLVREIDSMKIKSRDVDLSLLIKSAKNRDGHLYEGILAAAATNLTNMGRFAFNMGDFDESIRCYEKALEAKPDFQPALIGLRQSFSRMDKAAPK